MQFAHAVKFASSLFGITKEAREAFNRSDFTVRRKDDRSPVTQIDLVTQRAAIALCRLTFGEDVVIVAEESGYDAQKLSSASPWTVFIDPIDGTIPLCAGDISHSNISIGVFRDGNPFIGFIGQLGTGRVLFGGEVVDGIYEMSRSDDHPVHLTPRTIAAENKLWGFEIGNLNWGDRIYQGTLLNLFAEPTNGLGYNHFILPCVASGLKVVMGHARFYIGGLSSKSWDVAALMSLLTVQGYHLVNLENGEALTVENSGKHLPSFVMADSVESIEYVLSRRPQ